MGGISRGNRQKKKVFLLPFTTSLYVLCVFLLVTLHWHCPLVLLQSGSKPLLVSQWHGPQVGDPHQPLGHWWSILHAHRDTESLTQDRSDKREKHQLSNTACQKLLIALQRIQHSLWFPNNWWEQRDERNKYEMKEAKVWIELGGNINTGMWR